VLSLDEGGKAPDLKLKLNLCCFSLLVFPVSIYSQCAGVAATWRYALSVL
jgi:hypothetical protein